MQARVQTTRLPARFTVTVAALALALHGCERADDATPAAPAEPAHPHFWLRHGHLADTVTGPPTRFVEGPIRVERQANGFVRSVAAEDEHVEGYLSASELSGPIAGEGLMLYAHHVVDLHSDAPDGAVVGRLHPGAFVSVQPFDDQHWTIAVPAFHFRAVVERDALGLAPVGEIPPALPGNAFPVLWRTDVWTESGVRAASLLCGEAWRSGNAVAQYHSGVEITGVLAARPSELGPGQGCAAQRVFRQDGRYVLDGGGADAKPIDRIPDGFLEFGVPSDDPLEALIRTQARIFWLTWTDTWGLACQEWRFGKSHVIEGAPPHEAAKILVSRMTTRGWPDKLFSVVAYQRPARGSAGNLVVWPDVNEWGAQHPLLGVEGGTLYFGPARTIQTDISEIPRVAIIGDGYRKEGLPGSSLVAVRREGLRRWFTTMAACEQAQREAGALAGVDAGALMFRVNLEMPAYTFASFFRPKR